MTTVGASAAPQMLWEPGTSIPVPRRVGVAWALLWVNILTFYAGLPLVVHIPSIVGKLITQGSLVACLLLLVGIRGTAVRRNLMMVLFSVIAIVTLMMSFRFVGIGTAYRAVRLSEFVAALWLFTRWWGDRDMVFLRYQRRVLLVIVGTVLLGAVVAHHDAFAYGHRLGDAFWPMYPTNVAHYAAELAGLTLVLLAAGSLRRNPALAVAAVSVGVVVETHTRTALVGLIAGLIVAGMSLLSARRGLRRAVASVVVVLIVLGPLVAPGVQSWLERGQDSAQIADLTGRTKVWTAMLDTPRPLVERVFGEGMTNDSFDGRPIDDSWLAIYQDQGLVGDLIMAVLYVSLLLLAATRPRGPARAAALFLLVYCLPASITETGLAQANPFMLDLFVAASLLVSSPRQRPPDQLAV